MKTQSAELLFVRRPESGGPCIWRHVQSWLNGFCQCLVLVAVLTSTRVEAQQALRAVELYALDGMNYAIDVNDSGQVVGGDFSQGFRVWHYGDMTEINAPQGVNAAGGINASGQVAVSFNDGSAGRWREGVVEVVVPPMYPPHPQDLDRYRTAIGINDLGHLVGVARTFGFEHPVPGAPPITVLHAYKFANGGMTDLGVLPGESPPYMHSSEANNINSFGQAVGWSESFSASQPIHVRPMHATLFFGGTPIDLGTLGGVQSVAFAINDLGEIVGWSENAQGNSRPFLMVNGVMSEIPGITATSGQARDINDAGDIVGFHSGTGSAGETAFARIDGQTHDLNVLAADLLADGSGPGFVYLKSAVAINNLRQIAGYGDYIDTPGGTPYFKGFLLDLDEGPPGFKVHDSNRLGNVGAPLAGVTVTFIAGELGVVASAVTDATGAFSMDGLNVEPLDLHDIQLVKGDWQRTYQAVRPQQVLDGTVRLVLPVLLQEKLKTELVKLRDTGLLVADYDVERAQALSALHNRLFPELLAAHQGHNEALARLLAATESLSRIYAAVEPLAKDAGKLLADNLIAFMAIKDASAQVGAGAAAEMAASTLSSRIKEVAVAAIIASLKHTTDVAQKALVKGSQSLLPPWAAELVNQSSSDIIAGVLGAFASGEWDSAKGKAEGRKKVLENLAKLLGEQVAGRIIASAHVSQTQLDFDLAEVRARTEQGAGTPAEGFVASQLKAIEVEEKADLALQKSSLIDDTATKFGYVADYADAVGKIPAAQIAALMSRMIKVLNLGLVVEATVTDFSTLSAITFDDTQLAAERAFFPAGMGTPAPAPAAADSLLVTASEAPSADQPSAAALAPGFASELAAFRAAVVAVDAAAALTAAENMLALNGALEEQIEAALLQARARALSASPADPVLNAAYTDLQNAAIELRAAIAEMYPATAGYFAPQLADPSMSTSGLLTLVDGVTAAIGSFDAAEAAAQTAGSGITAPALVVTLSHGLHGAVDATRTVPGLVSLRARIVNAGGVAASNVTAELVPAPVTSAVQPFVLTTAAQVLIGTLAPGQLVEVTWSGIATDVSATGIGSVAGYRINLLANGTRAEGDGGGFEVRSEQQSFASWIAGFSGLGTETGLGDDPDDDGIASGLERFFGQHPGAASTGLRLLSNSGLPFLEHTRAAEYGSDTTATYEWSADLSSWQPSGTAAGGVNVRLEPVVIGGTGDGLKTVQVIPQVTGVADRLFYRMKVTPNAPVPPDPVPVPPQITVPPASLTVLNGQPASLSVTVSGTGPILYQWQKDGADIIGAIDRTHSIPEADSSHSGSYTVRIIAPGGQITTSAVTLTVEFGGA